MKPYTDEIVKVDERKCLYSQIRGNNKPRKKAARRIAKIEIALAISEIITSKTL